MPTTRKTTASKGSTKKVTSKASTVIKASAKSAKVGMPSSKSKAGITPLAGYTQTRAGIYVQEKDGLVVSPSKFKKGLTAAQEAIKDSISEFAKFMTQDMEVSEIELSISFDAKGEFLGFGVGGAASVKIKIKPCQ